MRRADGTDAVLSRGANVAGLRRAASALDAARARGLPVPRYTDVVEVPGGVALLQERMPGHVTERVDDALVGAILGVVDRLRHVLADEPDVPTPDLYLLDDGPGFCVHGTLERHGPQARRLLAWVHDVGRAHGTTTPGDDLVHLDLHPANVLVDDAGRLTAVVDWDAAGRGDARIGVVTLLFDLAHGRRFDPRYAGLTEDAVGAVEARVRAIEPDRRRQLWAHMALRQVDWTIRHGHPAAVVEDYLAFALRGIGRFDLG
ncbi:aminoglycoside phosphotransferase [Beutenbergia cavernae DSM 12333]|uniref:Aminoglycoside phosphotransferase n=1 Tax=Beutenbergia cavernae (strain ATCC BAA-8 / DSM 12333 / CCUG 43141 / JCM 11478 / NBRC 16432 / NCIMB 13614 / HKI 0122) TaxID=471853 RepID=C5C2S9_BEUC1|nr:aminoglycoside phosphotransferase family protein [Beutenbergia cavernae]ACQ81773.1 aminoglycoside phosphotransferase [Beutenbergia cavernae DSM 12333]